MARKQGFSAFRPKLISIAVASCFAAGTALANPTGPQVVNGTAAILQNGNLLQVTNSPNAIINWQSFSIGASEITRFIQPSQASAVLNRVTGSAGAINPSVILGALQSNGRVFLVNPSGILFGAGAQIDVAGLVATSLNISNADFLANRLKFSEVPGAGSVINQGNITTGQGGQVYLVGPAITNSGIITSPNGEVVLAAGNSVELVSPGTPNLRVEITAPDNEARNLGQIVVDSGRAGIYAGLVNQSGTIRADSVVAEGGKILLKATKNATLEAGSVTTANGPSGGSVTIQSGDTTLVAGTIEAKGLGSPPSEGGVAPAGDGVVGKGGTVQILGNLVGLVDNASINVSGDTGGGTVLVGGDFQGKNPEVQNAFRAYVGPTATISADAVTNGDGGKVIVWSDDTTRYYGSISARGGANSGDGGFVEVSGKQNLGFNGVVDTRAPMGKTGTLLLDPATLTIINGAGGDQDAQLIAGNNILVFDADTALNTVSEVALEALAANANVVVAADGQITVNNLADSLLDMKQTSGQFFQLSSGTSGGITFVDANDRIQTNGGNITLAAFGTGSLTNIGHLRSNGGAINLFGGTGGITLGSGAMIEAGTGSVSLDVSGGGAMTLSPAATIAGSNVTLNSGGGIMSLGSGASGTVLTQTDLDRVSLTDLANGSLSLFGMQIAINSPIAFNSLKVQNLHLSGNNLSGAIAITQALTAPLTVKNLSVDGGEGNVNMSAANMVDTLAGLISNCCTVGDRSFVFNNAKPLTIGTVAGQSGINVFNSGSGSGGDAAINVSVTSGNLTINQPVSVTIGSPPYNGNSATINLAAAGNIAVNSNLTASGGTQDTGTGGAANISVMSSGGSINIGTGAIIAATSGYSLEGVSGQASISFQAPQGAITSTGGLLQSVNGSFGGGAISLQAMNGIGTPAAPVRIDWLQGIPSLNVRNLGATGDVALSFYNNSSGTFVFPDLAGIYNANPTGAYYFQADPLPGFGNLQLDGPFKPNGADPGPGQTVHLAARAGYITLVGPQSGSISGAAQVTLEARDLITLDASTSISAGNVLLKSDNMDIQGTVTAANNILVQQFTPSRAIELGGALIDEALALDSSELARLTALGLLIGTNSGSGPMSVTAAIGPFNAFPNFFGSSITQTAPITSPGGLSAFSTGNIMLTNAANNIGSFGGVSGGNLSVVTTGNIGLGVVSATSSASVTSSGGLVYNIAGPAGLITAPTISLTGATGVGQAGAPIFVSGVTSLAATNTGSGDISISYATGNFTIGIGGWNLSNAGGDYIIGGNTVTLNSGAPSGGDMFIGANDAIVAASGYTNSGIVVLSALNDVNVNGNLTANDIGLIAGNAVNINGAIASAAETVSVLATSLNITGTSTPAQLKAGTDLGIVAGEIVLQGGSGTGAFAELHSGSGAFDVFTIASPVSTGNIVLKGGTGSGAYARIFGDPDVGSLLFPVAVGGVIQMNAGTGTGAFARIESASVNSIHVDFTNLGSGGFFVNGVEGTVASGDSGFFAGGQPAVLGQNLIVTYGGPPPIELIQALPGGVQQAIDQLAAVTNDQTTLTQENTVGGDGESGIGTGDPKDEKQKKALPICGK